VLNDIIHIAVAKDTYTDTLVQTAKSKKKGNN